MNPPLKRMRIIEGIILPSATDTCRRKRHAPLLFPLYASHYIAVIPGETGRMRYIRRIFILVIVAAAVISCDISDLSAFIPGNTEYISTENPVYILEEGDASEYFASGGDELRKSGDTLYIGSEAYRIENGMIITEAGFSVVTLRSGGIMIAAEGFNPLIYKQTSEGGNADE